MKKILLAISVFFVFSCDDSSSVNINQQSDATADQNQAQDKELADQMHQKDSSLDAEMTGDQNTTAKDMSVSDLLCQDCQNNDDCGSGFFCNSEKYCTKSCESDDDCPSDYECKSTSDDMNLSDMGHSSYCAPKDGKCGDILCDDQDGDLYGRGPDCLGLDCDDSNPNINPGVSRDLCDNADNDCDGKNDESFESASCGNGSCAGTTICMMGAIQCQQAVAMGNDDNCNGVDEDCDDRVDEAYQAVSCGNGACMAQSSCSNGVENCEPTLPNPSDTDQSCDLIDSDCDGVVDEGYVGVTCGVGVCLNQATCSAQGQACVPRPSLGSDDDCNMDDDDCDGRVDESFQSDLVCGLGACQRNQACDGNGGVSCTPAQPLSDHDRTCDNIDDNCNGFVDEDCATNSLSFQLIESGADFIKIAVVLSRGLEIQLNRVTLPQSIDVRFNIDNRLSYLAQSATISSALSDQGYQLNQGRIDGALLPPGKLRFFILLPMQANNTNDPRILPGEIFRFSLSVPANVNRPFALSWLEAEAFTDQNGNGLYDDCLDLNFNQICDLGEMPEPFIDSNQNGRRDANTMLAPEIANEIMVLQNTQIN
jgi:hypothetical protein